MKTSLQWDNSFSERKLPTLPEGLGNFECERLQIGDKLKIIIEGYCDESDITVTQVDITFDFAPTKEWPFAKECDCIQWVTVKPEWDEGED